MVHKQFFFSYTDMMKHAHDNGFDVNFVPVDNIYLHWNRETLANEAKRSDADYIFWVDVDQTYPKDTISILANHIDNGCMVVGGMTADKRNGKHLCYTFKYGSRMFAGVEKTPLKKNQGLKEVECLGFGGIMMNLKVFEGLPEPHFSFKNSETVIRDVTHIGEDFAFYWKCKKAGVDVWCDTDLQYGHMATNEVFPCDE